MLFFDDFGRDASNFRLVRIMQLSPQGIFHCMLDERFHKSRIFRCDYFLELGGTIKWLTVNLAAGIDLVARCVLVSLLADGIKGFQSKTQRVDSIVTCRTGRIETMLFELVPNIQILMDVRTLFGIQRRDAPEEITPPRASSCHWTR